MKIKLNPNRHRRGVGIVLWLLVLIFVIFIVIIAGIAVTMVKTIKKICPPPPPDAGLSIGLGSRYAGGLVIGWVPRPVMYRRNAETANLNIESVLIYASDTLYPMDSPNWTNLIWEGPESDIPDVSGTNGLALESFETMPNQRFYNVKVRVRE